ncbi:hypothetical protein HOD29_05030 [archaeon]|jgi:hypothetical protein|nr:hypothetical protein [archaeon]
MENLYYVTYTYFYSIPFIDSNVFGIELGEEINAQTTIRALQEKIAEKVNEYHGSMLGSNKIHILFKEKL